MIYRLSKGFGKDYFIKLFEFESDRLLAIFQQQEKWNKSSIRNWSEIYPQLSIFFSEIMAKYER